MYASSYANDSLYLFRYFLLCKIKLSGMAGKQFFNVYVIGNKYAYKYIRININIYIITKYALIYMQISRVFVAKFSRKF